MGAPDTVCLTREPEDLEYARVMLSRVIPGFYAKPYIGPCGLS